MVPCRGGPTGDSDDERSCEECDKDGLCSTEAVELKIGDEVWRVRFHNNGRFRDMVWT